MNEKLQKNGNKKKKKNEKRCWKSLNIWENIFHNPLSLNIMIDWWMDGWTVKCVWVMMQNDSKQIKV